MLHHVHSAGSKDAHEPGDVRTAKDRCQPTRWLGDIISRLLEHGSAPGCTVGIVYCSLPWVQYSHGPALPKFMALPYLDLHLHCVHRTGGSHHSSWANKTPAPSSLETRWAKQNGVENQLLPPPDARASPGASLCDIPHAPSRVHSAEPHANLHDSGQKRRHC